MSLAPRLLNLFPVFLFALILASSGASADGEFLSDPVESVHPFETYEYTVVPADDWGNLTLDTTADWLLLDGLTIRGIPTEEHIGSYRVTLNLTNDEVVASQSFVLEVLPVSGSATVLVLGLVVGFGLMAVGFFDHRWMFFAGVVWLYIGLAILGIYGIPWLLIGVGIGFVLLLDGALAMAEEGGI